MPDQVSFSVVTAFAFGNSGVYGTEAAPRRCSCMQKLRIEHTDFAARKGEYPFITHAAEFAGKRASIHTEKIGQRGAGIWKGVHAVGIRRKRLQIDFKPIPQALLPQNAHLRVEGEHLPRKFLHQIGRHLHPAGTAHRAFGKQHAEIEQHHRADRRRPQADGAGHAAGAGQLRAENLPLVNVCDGDLVAVFVVEEFLDAAAQQHARAAGRLSDLRDMYAALIVNGSRLKAEKHRSIALGRNAAHHAALL